MKSAPLPDPGRAFKNNHCVPSLGALSELSRQTVGSLLQSHSCGKIMVLAYDFGRLV